MPGALERGTASRPVAPISERDRAAPVVRKRRFAENGPDERDPPMPPPDDLLALARAIARRDCNVMQLLRASPTLARASFRTGATRRHPSTWFPSTNLADAPK